MKKFILLLFISLCLYTVVNAQTWRKAFYTPIPNVHGGFMVDQNTAWLVADSLNIFKSTDGGMTWVNKFRTETASTQAKDVCFVNSITGFVACEKGKILKTTDGGETWQTFLTPDTNLDNLSIHFFDSNLGYTVADSSSKKSIIYKTTDGGTTWTNTASISDFVYSLDFSSPIRGIAAGGNFLYYTTDGTTWNVGKVPTNWPSISYSRTDQWSVKFISPTTAVSCGWGSFSVGLEPTIFLKTTDAGATWSYLNQSDQNRTYANFYSQYFKDSLNGIATGGFPNPGTIICRTTDGGTNWVPLPVVAGFASHIVMGFNNKVILSGFGGNIIVSTDFGDSWVAVNKYPSETTYSISAINNNIYAGGYDGTFFKSTDQGKTFNMTYMTSANKCLNPRAMQFLNENLGYVADQYGQALKTTDAGNSWTQIIRDSVSNVINSNGLYFINENIGFVVGNSGSNVDIIYKTTDGGQSWSSVQNIAFQNLNCISFADDMHGAAGGNYSAMLYTTDQGVTWKTAKVNANQLAIKAIKFYDGLNGIAVGASIILTTTDGGANWNPVNYSTSATLNSVYYSNSVFYAAGGKYCLKSTDEGNTWQNILDSVFTAQYKITTLNSIGMDNSGYLWLAGNGGIITNSPSITGISNDVAEPFSFQLGQNYPNPFNPSTSINFTINKSGLVTLKLFDILGREVRSIFKGELTSGAHKINLNAGNLASGVYIYTLQENDQFTSRKMTLLK